MNVLNLKEFNVLKQEGNEYDYLFTVEKAEEPYLCVHCKYMYFPEMGNNDKFKLHGKRDRLVTDISMHGKRVKINIIHKRYKCPKCESTFYELLDSVDTNDKITKRLYEHIQKEALKKPFITVADEYGLSNMTVRRAFDDYVKVKDSERVLKAPRVIGIDEAHLNKVMRGVLTDIKNRRILEMTENNHKPSIKSAIMSMEGWENIQVATMDMATGYRAVVNDILPDCLCIIDKFHVIQEANRTLNKQRILIKNKIKKDMADAKALAKANNKGNRTKKKITVDEDKEEHDSLFRDRWLLLSNKEDLDKKSEYLRDEMFLRYPDLETAYWLKETLRDIYNIPDRKTAYEIYYAWERSIPDNMPLFKALANTINNCKKEVFNYFLTDVKYTNAYTESINNLIKRIEKSGVGYSFDVLRAKVLYGTTASKKPKYGEKHFYAIQHMISAYNNPPQLVTKTDYDNVIEGSYVDITTLLQLMDEGNF